MQHIEVKRTFGLTTLLIALFSYAAIASAELPTPGKALLDANAAVEVAIEVASEEPSTGQSALSPTFSELSSGSYEICTSFPVQFGAACTYSACEERGCGMPFGYDRQSGECLCSYEYF